LAFSCIESSFQLFVCYTVLQKTVFTCILLPDPVWIFPRTAKNRKFETYFLKFLITAAMELSMAVFCFENLLTLFYAYSGRFTKK